MYGAIIGDLAGSIYEYSQIKSIKPITCNNIIEENSFISDDTILTIAILDAILTHRSYEDTLKEYGQKYLNYLPSFKPYFKTVFSPGFTNWINGQFIGTSKGNGAMMRISPIGYLFDTEEEIIRNVRLATIPSHRCKESISSATIIALIIFYARKGFSKDKIIKKLNLTIVNHPLEKFNMTCQETIDICLYVLFNSETYEDCIRNILMYGGDTDTNACIVGSMAEAMYGLDSNLIEKSKEYLPEEFQKKLTLGYKQISKLK